jgi:hypothetical protein
MRLVQLHEPTRYSKTVNTNWRSKELWVYCFQHDLLRDHPVIRIVLLVIIELAHLGSTIHLLSCLNTTDRRGPGMAKRKFAPEQIVTMLSRPSGAGPWRVSARHWEHLSDERVGSWVNPDRPSDRRSEPVWKKTVCVLASPIWNASTGDTATCGARNSYVLRDRV